MKVTTLFPFSTLLRKKQEVEKHFREEHSHSSLCILRIFYVDPSTSNENFLEEKEKSKPLWAREMEGIKHIRGILYDDFIEEKELKKIPKLSIGKKIKKEKERKEEVAEQNEEIEAPQECSTSNEAKSKCEISKTELDYYPMVCKECSFPKKTVTGLKMHIKLNHLQLGKFQCQHCIFTANLKVSIQGHYRNKHPEKVTKEDGKDTYDYIERSSDAKAFSQDYWKESWGIPTMDERKILLERKQHGDTNEERTIIVKKHADKRKNEVSTPEKGGNKKAKASPGAKRGRKRKIEIPLTDSSNEVQQQSFDDFEANIKLAEQALESLESTVPSTIPISLPVENSPFESHKTFMCMYCPKRSQNLEKIRNHHSQKHHNKPFEFQELNRDQVVSIITSDQSHGTNDSDYKCFYCQHIGCITNLRDHNNVAHNGQVFRVVKFQGKGITGYLECQLCGHLSPGFEKHMQKAHFHEEHPLETDVNYSKYMSKSKVGAESFASSQQAFKVRTPYWLYFYFR